MRKKIGIGVGLGVMMALLGAGLWLFLNDNASKRQLVAAEQEQLLAQLPWQQVIFTDEHQQQIWVTTYEQLGLKGKITDVAQGQEINLFLDEECAVAELERLYGEQLLQAQPAYFKVTYDNKVTIVPEQEGERLLYDVILAEILAGAGLQGPLTVKFSCAKETPAVTAEQLASLQIEQLWGEFSTNFNGSDQKRTGNIWLASSQIMDYILAPEEIFSFNEVVGPRTAERGYGEAGVIINNQKASDIGGGVCQVSTTLYNAAKAAGMTIVELHHHTIPVHYVTAGRDAAVVYGYKDLRFKNTTTHAVLIKSYFAYGKLTFKIFGATTAAPEEKEKTP